MTAWRRFFRDRRAVSAVEFAIVAPLLLTMVGGLADFGLMLWRRELLAIGVAEAAQYAYNTGSGVVLSNVQTIVQKTSTLGTAAIVTMPPAACYCVSGNPATTSAQTCGQLCSSTNSVPGLYVTIAATYTYQPLLPLLDHLTNTTIRQSAMVRLQ